MASDHPTHAWCDICDRIQPVTIEPLTTPDTTHLYLGGDVVCDGCSCIIVTLYRKAGTGVLQEQNPLS